MGLGNGDDFRSIGTGGEEVGDGLVQDRVNQGGGDVAEREEREAPLGEAGMRHRQQGGVKHEGAEKQDVDVDGTGSVCLGRCRIGGRLGGRDGLRADGRRGGRGGWPQAASGCRAAGGVSDAAPRLLPNSCSICNSVRIVTSGTSAVSTAKATL